MERGKSAAVERTGIVRWSMSDDPAEAYWARVPLVFE